ncbi:MAG: 50S ribosomal protein L22, partial [Mycoplasmataceae bacterium]|nr:50S ribosomal protein L22 [Mycoplasmataceae bacterium]
MEVKASSKMNRISAQKANLTARLIRGVKTDEAVAILENTSTKASKLYLKVLNSAIANAVENHGLMSDELYVKSATAGEGPTIKRYLPRAKGRADKISKRTSHLYITLVDEVYTGKA